MLGCNRSCSIGTPTPLETAKKTFKIDGRQITISASLIQYDKKFAGKTFRLYFDVKMGSFSREKFTYDIIENPSLVDLQDEVNQFQIQLSDDHSHLALGHNNRVDKVYHLYKMRPVYAKGLNRDNNYDIDLNLDWTKLDINNFTDVEDVLRLNYKYDCGVAYLEDDMRLFFLQNMTPSDTLHEYFFNKWPGCQFYTSFLDSAQVELLKSDSNWLNLANNRIETFKSEYDRTEWQDDEVQRLELLINDSR